MTETTEPKKMNSIYIVAGVVVAIILISVGAWAFTNQMNNDAQMKTEMTAKTQSSDTMMKKDDTAMKMEAPVMTKPSQDIMMKQEEPKVAQKDETMMATLSAGKYVPYSADLVANQTTDAKVVIFFNASWCSTCQSTVKDINANLSNIPANVSILSADYDKETALRQKYGVTMQHTFVLVDKDGNLVKKANGLSTVKSIADFAV